MKRMGGCQQQLRDLRNQLDAVTKRKAEIITLLDKAVDESHPQREALLTIFHRKLKRSKKQANDEDEDESDEDEGDDDDFDDDEMQEICPPGCDQALYDEVRLQQEWVSSALLASSVPQCSWLECLSGGCTAGTLMSVGACMLGAPTQVT